MRVKVYEDPVTCTRLEGEARLVKRADTGGMDGQEYWKVCFVADNFVCWRRINIEKH